MIRKPRYALLKKPSQQIIIASQSKKPLYCEVPFTSIACSLDVLHAESGHTLTKGTTSYQNLSLNMHEAKYACIHGQDVQLLYVQLL